MKSLHVFRPSQVITAAALAVVLLVAGIVAVVSRSGSSVTMESVAKKRACSQGAHQKQHRGDQQPRGPKCAQGAAGGAIGMDPGMAGLNGQVPGMDGLNGQVPGMDGLNGQVPGMDGLNGQVPGMDGLNGQVPGTDGLNGQVPGMDGLNGQVPGMDGLNPGTNGMTPGTDGANPGASGTNPGASPGDGDLSAKRAEILRLTNEARAKVGCKPLKANAQLNQAAQAHSERMNQVGQMDHYDVGDGSPGSRMFATGYDVGEQSENIASETTSASEAMSAWMNSPPHRTAIEYCNYEDLGVGYSNGYWTQDFAAPLSAQRGR